MPMDVYVLSCIHSITWAWFCASVSLVNKKIKKNNKILYSVCVRCFSCPGMSLLAAWEGKGQRRAPCGMGCAWQVELGQGETAASPGAAARPGLHSRIRAMVHEPPLEDLAQHPVVDKVLPLLSLPMDAVAHKSNTNVPEVPVCPKLLAPLCCACGCAQVPEQGHVSLCCF